MINLTEHSFVPSEDYGEERRVCEHCGVYEDYKELPCSREKENPNQAD